MEIEDENGYDIVVTLPSHADFLYNYTFSMKT